MNHPSKIATNNPQDHWVVGLPTQSDLDEIAPVAPQGQSDYSPAANPEGFHWIQQELFRQQRALFAELAHQHEAIARSQSALAEKEKRMDNYRVQLHTRELHIREKEGRIAQHQAELEVARLELEKVEQRLEEAARAKEAMPVSEVVEVSAPNEELLGQLDLANARREQLERELEEMESEAQSQQAMIQASMAQMRTDNEGMHEELTALRQQLHDHENELQSRPPQDDEMSQVQGAIAACLTDDRDYDGMERDLDEVKRQVVELTVENASLRTRVLKVAEDTQQSQDGAFDWEQQKRRMMEMLESENDEADEQEQEVRISIESTIQITDQIVAEKDREIAELKALLHERPQMDEDTSGLVLGANAVAEIFDRDELIVQERENLALLQKEWREKISQAEIDLAVERAKLARQHAELEEIRQSTGMINVAEKKGAFRQDAEPAKGKGGRGRWLERLGLNDSPEPKGK